MNNTETLFGICNRLLKLIQFRLASGAGFDGRFTVLHVNQEI